MSIEGLSQKSAATAFVKKSGGFSNENIDLKTIIIKCAIIETCAMQNFISIEISVRFALNQTFAQFTWN